MTQNSGALEYLMAHVGDVSDACLVWPYGVDGNGYGRVYVGGRRRGVHIIACEVWHGPRPEGKQAAHGPCHNPLCFNGAHLSWKTRQENCADKVRDGTQWRGETAPTAKLTEASVLAIRARYATGGISQRALGEMYGVHQVTVSEVVRRLIWTHI